MVDNRKVKHFIFINTGTPDAPTTFAVAKYLRQFLSDARVMRMPSIVRWLLVNACIVPFRSSRSARYYKRIWTKMGSPLLFNSINLVNKLSALMPSDSKAHLAMRYGNPSIASVLSGIDYTNVDEIVVVPLFPQYASCTTGSILQEAMRCIAKQTIIPKVRFVTSFFNREVFIDVWVKHLRTYNLNSFDKVLFSFHGLPVGQLNAVHGEFEHHANSPAEEFTTESRHCYRAQCHETARLISNQLGLAEDRCAVTFQSRMVHEWCGPFTDLSVERLAANGCKNILVIAPSFVADCLETNYELGQQLKRKAEERWNCKLTIATSLNDSELWAKACYQIASAI